MNPSLRLVLVLHNHQPIGNFDDVFEQAYQDSYLPFLEVFQRYEGLRIALHTSGSLMEWLDANHPEYVDQLAGLVASGRIEIVGGPFFEPILTMLSSRDRIGQIERYTEWLDQRLGATVRGMWMPERVWEQQLTADLVKAGIQYTVLDDFHFKNGGLDERQLDGYYVTEEDGHVLRVLPGSERLRYTIPFQEPHATIDYLRETAERRPGSVLVFGDDGEKFGTWPGTKRHVYEHGWLARFFEALLDNRDWLKVTTPSEMIENVPPLGKVYIPEGSYREMTEWSLPAVRINQYEDAHHHLEEVGEWERVRPFVRGGYWRNFKVKYPETNAMYARMQMVSRRLHDAIQDGASGELIEQARMELYRGQCNCSYWHGAFGGAYLPHLRNAVYRHLIAADNLLDQLEGRSWRREDDATIELTAEDYNLDGRPEIKLANNRLLLLANPADGGQIYQFDVKSICHNLQATLARRQEAYHRQVQRGPSEGGGDVASIHDRVVFKQEGLDQRLQVDGWLRNSLVDHFYPGDAQLDQVADGVTPELGDFLRAPYETILRRSEGRVQLQMFRQGSVSGRTFRLTKGVTLNAGQGVLEIAYFFEDVPGDVTLNFAPEWNFAGLPGGAHDRFFHHGDGQSRGHLGSRLDLHRIERLGLTDQWLGIDVQFAFDRPADVWTYPVETVSQSEGGFELVHQSVAVVPHWLVAPDAYGRWSVTFRVSVDTQLAESRMGEFAEACASR